MKAISLYLAIIGVCALYMGCQPRIDHEQEQKVLLETDKAFSRHSRDSGAAEAFNHYLADDALQLPASRQPLSGREAIYRELKASEGSYVLQWEPKHADVSLNGDMGYTWGTFTVTIQDSLGKSNQRFGKYVNVWKKQADGSWKVVVDIGNQNPSPSSQ